MTRDQTHKEILLVALGGNALIRKGQVGTVEEQFINLRPPVSQIAELSGVTIQETGERRRDSETKSTVQVISQNS
jgi:seryl-tRNA(Sec) selenium transferase